MSLKTAGHQVLLQFVVDVHILQAILNDVWIIQTSVSIDKMLFCEKFYKNIEQKIFWHYTVDHSSFHINYFITHIIAKIFYFPHISLKNLS